MDRYPEREVRPLRGQDRADPARPFWGDHLLRPVGPWWELLPYLILALIIIVSVASSIKHLTAPTAQDRPMPPSLHTLKVEALASAYVFDLRSAPASPRAKSHRDHLQRYVYADLARIMDDPKTMAESNTSIDRMTVRELLQRAMTRAASDVTPP